MKNFKNYCILKYNQFSMGDKMITLSIATGIISFLIAVLKVALGSNEPEKVPLNEKEYDLMNYNSITETYTIN